MEQQWTTAEVWSLVSSIVSIVVTVLLGAIAIGLSVYFYKHTKNTETNVAQSLSAIQGQTDTLKSLVGKQMSQLVKGYTERRPEDSLVVMLEVIKELPLSIAARLQQPSAGDSPALRTYAITCNLISLLYAGLSNVLLQWNLPSIPELNESNQWIETRLNDSHADFRTLDTFLGTFTATEVSANPSAHLMPQLETLKAIVKNSTEVWVARAAQAEATPAEPDSVDSEEDSRNESE